MATDYNKAFARLQELTHKSTELQRSFLQHTLLVASSMFGILVSLHSATPVCQCIRWVFALAVATLALGVLTCAIALYSQTGLVERARQKFVAEHVAALKESRDPEAVFVNKTPMHVVCEQATYLLLITALLLLGVYSVWSSLTA